MSSNEKIKNNLGSTLVIVNPVAQSGKSSKKGFYVFDLLRRKYNQDADIYYTKHQNHAQIVAKDSANYDSVIVVGGDGVVHEVASGLMEIPETDRPVMGVVPVGSGNDYARSLGIPFNHKKAVDAIMYGQISPVDVGRCNDKFFVETLSIGLDAGIALDTVKAREKSNEKGFKLYFKCGINRIKNHFDMFDFHAKFDNETVDGTSLMLAIQIGKTYGSGFKITPDALIDDGYFNICYTQGKLSRRVALPLFARAAKGKHVGNKHIVFKKAKAVELSIDQEMPCQIDGEEYKCKEFKIDTLHQALSVYKPQD